MCHATPWPAPRPGGACPWRHAGVTDAGGVPHGKRCKRWDMECEARCFTFSRYRGRSLRPTGRAFRGDAKGSGGIGAGVRDAGNTRPFDNPGGMGRFQAGAATPARRGPIPRRTPTHRGSP